MTTPTSIDPVRVMQAVRTWYVERSDTAWVATASPEELARHSKLTRVEADAICAADLGALSAAGVAPFTLVQLARVRQFDLAQRWRQIQEGGGP